MCLRETLQFQPVKPDYGRDSWQSSAQNGLPMSAAILSVVTADLNVIRTQKKFNIGPSGIPAPHGNIFQSPVVPGCKSKRLISVSKPVDLDNHLASGITIGRDADSLKSYVR